MGRICSYGPSVKGLGESIGRIKLKGGVAGGGGR